jgi:UDP-N-acetylglucosamine/UDP-N-acetylgalactosamine diphosphorylase
MAKKEELLGRLRPFGQEHLLAFWNELDASQQATLADEIAAIDFELIRRLHAENQTSENWAELARRAESPPAVRLNAVDNPFTPQQARARGQQAIRAGEVGVILVAGGQGTRLGFDHPKGMFPIGPVSGVTIFQILLEKIQAVGRRYGVRVPLYVMTSPATDAETVRFLREKDYFGLPAQDVHVFCQGTMPAVDASSGKLLLAEKSRLFLSPDGHGGMLAALKKTGALADLRSRGLQQMYYFQVDNPLAVVCDPELIGGHLLSQAEVSTQVVAKRTPRDNVGNVVSIDGKVRILEYSDLNPLPDEIVLRTQPDGSPVFWAGNIAVHVLEVAFLERMAESETSLPFHIARKKVPTIDEHGQPIEPDKPNAKKFERFIFDLLPSAERSIVVEVDEQRTFAPLKNAPGAERDSPATVRAQMIALHTEWLRAAGAIVDEGVAVEISPLFALDAEDLAGKIARGTHFSDSTYLRPGV